MAPTDPVVPDEAADEPPEPPSVPGFWIGGVSDEEPPGARGTAGEDGLATLGEEPGDVAPGEKPPGAVDDGLPEAAPLEALPDEPPDEPPPDEPPPEDCESAAVETASDAANAAVAQAMRMICIRN